MNRSVRLIAQVMILAAAVAVHAQLTINIWHGQNQKVGHLGHAQDDFNVMGNITPAGSIASVSYSLNGDSQGQLTWHQGRRIAATGDFNADIPVKTLRAGDNEVTIFARDLNGTVTSKTMTIQKLDQEKDPPAVISWGSVSNPQDVGQYVDGQWIKNSNGLKTNRQGYDRMFLLGNITWKDYQITVPVTIHSVERSTPAASGAPGVGLLVRFAGHEVDGHTRWLSNAQPKWGYLPFGSLVWLRWLNGVNSAADICFHRGDEHNERSHGKLNIANNGTYIMKMRVETLPDRGTRGVSRYSFKVWRSNGVEPEEWSFVQEQESDLALRKGGVALMAHHVDATFGNVQIDELVTGIKIAHARRSWPELSISTGISGILIGESRLPFADIYDARGRRLSNTISTRQNTIPGRGWYLFQMPRP